MGGTAETPSPGGEETERSPAGTTPAKTSPSPRDTREATPAARLQAVGFSYDGGATWALDHLDLTVRTGERLCILGANGSGKSTVAQLLCGLEAPDEGHVELAGTVCFDGAPHAEAYAAARRASGLVFQNPADQMVTTVVADDVAFGPENLRWSPERIGDVVARELHRVAMEPWAQANPLNLSGGQQQRVAIASALAMEPSLLVLDEPAAQLDVRGRRSLLHLLDRLQGDHTIVHITHFMDEALDADRVVVLAHGSVAMEGTPREVFSEGVDLGSLGLEEPFALRVVRSLAARGIHLAGSPLTEAEVAEAILHGPQPPHHPSSAPKGIVFDPETNAGDKAVDMAVSARDLHFSWGEGDVLRGISLDIARGSTTAVVGATGSGKSTLVRLLAGLMAPDSGQLRVEGIDCTRRRERRRLLGRVGYMMQRPERQLFAETVAADVAFGPENLGLDDVEVARRVDRVLSLCGLEGLEGRSPFDLSGGQQRLCALAGVLAMDPALLVMDEPMDGLDPRARAMVLDVLSHLHGRGCTIVLVDHDMDDVAALAQSMVVLEGGRVALSGTTEEVFSCGEVLDRAGLGLPRALAWARGLEEAGLPPLGAPRDADELAGAIAGVLAGGEGR